VEIFVDFGLFEFLAASGVAALGRIIYSRPLTRWGVLLLSVAAPAALVFLVTGETLRWIAALALGTSVINLSVLVRMAHQRVGAASFERAG
jgi:hypothetical protein